MDECSATVTVKKVDEKKKKKEEENVEETIEVEEEEEEEDEKKGPFDVKLKKAKQNKTVISVSFICRNHLINIFQNVLLKIVFKWKNVLNFVCDKTYY